MQLATPVVLLDAELGTNSSFTLLQDEDLVLDAGVALISSSGGVINGTSHTRIVLMADGAMPALQAVPAIDLTGAPNDYEVSVAEGASVKGRNAAVLAFSDIFVSNSGTITSTFDVAVETAGGQTVNHGVIDSVDDIAPLFRDDGFVSNLGTIAGETGALRADDSMDLLNNGAISGRRGFDIREDNPVASISEIVNAVFVENGDAFILN